MGLVSWLYQLVSISKIHAKLFLLPGYLSMINLGSLKIRNQTDQNVPGLVIAAKLGLRGAWITRMITRYIMCLWWSQILNSVHFPRPQRKICYPCLYWLASPFSFFKCNTMGRERFLDICVWMREAPRIFWEPRHIIIVLVIYDIGGRVVWKTLFLL